MNASAVLRSLPSLGSLRSRLRGSLRLSTESRKKWLAFRRNRRGYYSLWILGVLVIVTLFAELLANSKPLLVQYDGEWFVPLFVEYPEISGILTSRQQATSRISELNIPR